MAKRDDVERIRLLMHQALDDAFKVQVAKLYQTWLTNPGELEAARGRAAIGLQNAVNVYRTAVSALETWEG